LEGNKRYVVKLVETPDGNFGKILDYEETTDTYEVELESGKLGRFKPSVLKLRLSGSGGGRPTDSGPHGPGGGGIDDW